MTETFLAKWIKWVIWASALVPLIIFSQYISPFHFGKVVVLRTLVQVMLAMYLLLVWRDRSYLPFGFAQGKPRPHPILLAFVGFTAVFVLTTITSVAPLQSWWGTLERMGGLFTFLHYLVYFVILTSVLRTKQDWRVLLEIMIIVGACSAVYGYLQKTDWTVILGSGGRSRPFGTIGNAALYAGYQIVIAFLAVTLSLMKRSVGGWRIWYRIAAGMMILAAFLTAVRGSLLAIVVGALVYAMLWAMVFKSRRGKMALLGGVAAVVVFVFLGSLLRNSSLVQNSPYLTRVTAFSPQTFTVQTRFWAWTAGFQGWSETPKTILLGWGPENFNVPFSKHFNPNFFQGPGSETFFDRAHNMFMEVLVTMGLVGQLAYLTLFGAMLWTLWKMMHIKAPVTGVREQGVVNELAVHDTKVLGVGFAALTIAYAIHNSFIFDTSANYLVFFTVLGYTMHVAQRGIDAGYREQGIGNRGREKSWSGGQIAGAAMLGLITLIVAWNTNVVPAKANYASTRAIIAGWQGDFVTAVNKYREAMDYDVPGRYEYRHRFAQYLLELSSVADVSKVPEFKDVMLTAIVDVELNVQENPTDYLPLLYISRMYITLGKEDPASPYNDKALEYTNRALEISPTFVRTYYEVAQAYLNKKDLDNAFLWFDKARELQPNVGITYWYLGVVRYQQYTETLKQQYLQETLGYFNSAMTNGYALSEGDAQKLVGLYTALKDIPMVARIYEQLVASFPKKVEYWAQLIGAYTALGEREATAQTIQRALAVPEVAQDEDFVTKAQATLRGLGM
jgi:tetratricopeptide (TPR) repeat protein/O-antigen ligase